MPGPRWGAGGRSPGLPHTRLLGAFSADASQMRFLCDLVHQTVGLHHLFFFSRKASTAWRVCRTEGAGQVHLPPPGRTVPPPSCPVTRRGRPQGPTVESSVRAHPIGLMGAGFTLGGSPAMSGGHFWSLLLAEVGRWRPAGSGRALSTPHSQDSPARWASGPEASTPAPSSSLPQILQF